MKAIREATGARQRAEAAVAQARDWLREARKALREAEAEERRVIDGETKVLPMFDREEATP